MSSKLGENPHLKTNHRSKIKLKWTSSSVRQVKKWKTSGVSASLYLIMTDRRPIDITKLTHGFSQKLIKKVSAADALVGPT